MSIYNQTDIESAKDLQFGTKKQSKVYQGQKLGILGRMMKFFAGVSTQKCGMVAGSMGLFALARIGICGIVNAHGYHSQKEYYCLQYLSKILKYH